MKKSLCLFVFLALPALAKGSCGPMGKAKACPTSGSTLLDDTYPAAAHVISFKAFRGTEEASEVPSNFVLKVLESYDFSQNSPPVLVPSDYQAFTKLKAQLEQKIQESGGKIPSSVLDKVVHVPSVNYTWQQDYFESFFDPSSGAPVLRHIESYDRMDPGHTTKLAETGKVCGIQDGPVLKGDLYGPEGSFGNGEMGGNIEGLPGGLCLIGDNQSKKFAQQFCQKDENTVQIDVSWLAVGHVDEVVKILPTHAPGVPSECSFSLMLASPRKALELLDTPRVANHNFFSLKADVNERELESFRSSRSADTVGRKICKLYRDHILPGRSSDVKDSKEQGGGAKGAYLRMGEFLLSSAHAGAGVVGGKVVNDCRPDTITNREMKGVFEKDQDLREFNEAVQKKMDESRDKILAQILQRMPHCQKHIKIIEAPNLFYGTLKVDSDGSKELPRNGIGGSFIPNPTNGVISNKTMIFSDPQNGTFRDYLTQELKKTGLKTTYIDTWDYSHRGDGNLHCSSHTIPYCSPAKGGGK